MADVNWERLREQKFQGRLPHALCFSGPVETDFVWNFAQLLVCERENPPCGECGPCKRVIARQSESVLWIAPEKNTIKVEAAREILDFLSLQRVSKARVVVIEQAHLLNVQTANALLKAIEEPPPETYFVLITSEFSLLLPTLRSRVQTLRFAPKEYVPDPEQKELSELASRFLEEAGQGRREALDTAIAESKDRETALAFARLLQRNLRRRALENTEELPVIGALWQSAYKLELDVLANVDRALLLENFFYRARNSLS
jgi:hypothetical protein